MDIETLGKMEECPLPPITCACMLDLENKAETSLLFYKVDAEEFEKNKNLLLDTLDNADCIIGFNIMLFDLEYIKRFFCESVDHERLSRWILKSIDPFMFTKSVFRQTCSLDHLLTVNHQSQKTGSGSNAIQLALKGKWEELLAYCMTDVRLTGALFDNDLEGFFLSDFILVEWNLKKKSKFPKVRFPCLENKKDSSLQHFEWNYPELDFLPKINEDVYYES